MSGSINFFFCCFAHHRDVPSFPTRRSSDLNIGAGQTFTVINGIISYSSGSIGGTGTLLLRNAVTHFTRDSTAAVTTLGLSGATVNGPGTVTNADGCTLSIHNSTINTILINE